MLCVERGTREILAGEYGDLRRGRSEGVRDEMAVAGGRGQKDEGTRTLACNAVMLGRYRREIGPAGLGDGNTDTRQDR